jgi:hypothetical protein
MGSFYTVDDLIRLAPPPEHPVDAGSPDRWDGVERVLGTALPGDYKRFINVYGTGDFNDLFYVYNPFSGVDRRNLLWQAGVPGSLEKDEELGRVYPLDSDSEYFHLMRASWPDLDLPELYPEPGGLLPLGGDKNGGFAFWAAEGAPDEWPLVLYPHALHPAERHPMPLVEFLIRWLSGELKWCFHGPVKTSIRRAGPIFTPGPRPPRVEGQ